MGYNILTKENIESDNNNIIICYDKEKKAVELELNKNGRFFQDYNYLNINAYVIEIFPNDKINEKYFLSYEENFNMHNKKLENKKINYIQYTDNVLKLCNDYIRTNLPYDFKFTYFSNKDQICLGTPIFLEKSSNIFGISSSILNQKE